MSAQNKSHSNKINNHNLFHKTERTSASSFFVSKFRNLIKKKSTKLISIVTLIAIIASLIQPNQAKGTDFTPSSEAFQSTPTTLTNTLADYQTTAFTAGNYTSVGTNDTSYATTTALPISIRGEQAYTTAGDYDWTAPAGVTSVSVVCVGGGENGGGSVSGRGGALSYKNNISVVPGNSYAVQVGSSSGSSYFSSSSEVYAGIGSNRVGDGGGNGGNYSTGGGGGGAGGYSGAGGNGGLSSATAGSGGGGGGGITSGSEHGGGGGVGILGQGSSGAAGTVTIPGGRGGSGGANAGESGGLYGGGGGSGSRMGANGAVRIIWGTNRSFPSTNAGSLSSQYEYPYASQLYTFTPTSFTNYGKIDISLIANGTASAGNGINAKIWNKTTSQWVLLSSLTNTSATMPSSISTQSLTTNLSDYVDASNKIRILVNTINPSVSGTNAVLSTDYIKIAVWGAPSVTTNSVTSTTSTTATGSGNLTFTGGENPERFIEWGTSTGNYSAGSCSAGTGSTGTYTCSMTNLSPNTTYYYRAKASNSISTGYGSELSFATPALPVITITNPNTTPALSKTLTASTNKGTLTQSITTGSTCDGTLTFSAYASTTFSAEADNGKKICYRAVEAASGTSYLMSDAIAGIDRTLPIITITNPNTNPAQSKTLTASTNEGTLTQSITTGTVCNNTLTFSAYESTTFSAEADNGKKICYKAIDTATNTTYLMSNAIAGIDRTAPTGTAAVNGGATYTNSTSVTINNSITGASEMRYKNEAGGTFTSWLTYAASYAWNLVAGDGIKTLYGEFRDVAGNVFQTTDTITLDTNNPTISANNNSANWQTSNPTITLSTADTNLSYSKYSWDSSDATCRTSGTAFTNGNTINIPSQGSHTLYLCNQDQATNQNSWNGTYKLDSANPTINSVTSNCQNSTDPNFIINAEDNTSGLAASSYSFDSGATWQAENSKAYPAFSYSILADTIKVKDQAGNISTYNNPISQSCVTSSNVTTNNTTSITSISAIGNANLTNTNGENPERFIQWSTTSNSYNVTDQCSAGTGGTGTYSCNLTNLTPETTYYYRAKTTNSGGTSYGTEQSFQTLPESITIPYPDPDKLADASTNNYFTIGTGSLSNTSQARTNLDLTVTTDNGEATLPINTLITNTEIGQTIDMSRFTITDATTSTRSTQRTTRGAIEIGIPNTRLTFDQPITITIQIDEIYNGEILAVYSKSAGETSWTDENKTCTVTNGQCTFTTLHATTYTVNGDGTLRGDTTVNTHLPINATIALACDDEVNLNNITGTGQSTITANNEITCNIKTNNSTGYKLEWQASGTDMINANADAISAYDPATPNTPEIWSIDQTTSAWGARLKSDSTDKNTNFWGTVDDYNAGKWLNISGSNFQIISRTTETDQIGSDEIIQFGAEVGSNKFQPSGSYTTDVIFTATTL